MAEGVIDGGQPLLVLSSSHSVRLLGFGKEVAGFEENMSISLQQALEHLHQQQTQQSQAIGQIAAKLEHDDKIKREQAEQDAAAAVHDQTLKDELLKKERGMELIKQEMMKRETKREVIKSEPTATPSAAISVEELRRQLTGGSSGTGNAPAQNDVVQQLLRLVGNLQGHLAAVKSGKKEHGRCAGWPPIPSKQGHIYYYMRDEVVKGGTAAIVGGVAAARNHSKNGVKWGDNDELPEKGVEGFVELDEAVLMFFTEHEKRRLKVEARR